MLIVTGYVVPDVPDVADEPDVDDLSGQRRVRSVGPDVRGLTNFQVGKIGDAHGRGHLVAARPGDDDDIGAGCRAHLLAGGEIEGNHGAVDRGDDARLLQRFLRDGDVDFGGVDRGLIGDEVF